MTRLSYQEQLAQTHDELTKHGKQNKESQRGMRHNSLWIVGWAFIGMLYSFLQVQPLLLGIGVGVAVFFGGVFARFRGWRIFEWIVSFYISVAIAHHFIMSEAVQPIWAKWGIGLLLGFFFFSAYWSMKDMYHVFFYAHRNADQNTQRLQSRLIGHRQAYAKRTTKTQRHRNKSGSADFTENEWMDLCFHYDYTCLRCSRREPEIMITPDHVVPLARGGTNTIDNIQPLCLQCNVAKNARFADYRGGQ